MTVQTNLAEHATNFSLSGLRKQKQAIRNTTLDGVELVVEFNTPKQTDFQHFWTLTNISSISQLEEEKDNTLTAAIRRLQLGLVDQSDDIDTIEEASKRLKTDELLRKIETTFKSRDEAEQVEQFEAIKQREEGVDEAIDTLESLYQGIGAGRSRAIGRDINKNTDTLQEFDSTVGKVIKTLQFENRVDLSTEQDIFETDRQATTNVEWFNDEGEARRMVLFSQSGASVQDGQGNQLRSFESKDEAKDYYLDNRIG